MEVKDHLLARIDHALEQGATREVAAHQALEAFGAAEDFATEQRARIWCRFWQTALAFGTAFAVIMAVIEALSAHGSRLAHPVVAIAIQGVLFGLSFGFLIAFILPGRSIPSSSDTQRFVVRPSAPLAGLTYVGLTAFAGASAMCLAAALGLQIVGGLGLTRPLAVLLGVMALHNTRAFWLGLTSITVDDRGLEIRRPLFYTRVPWARVLGVHSRGDRKTWLPQSAYWKRVHEIEYASPTGRTCRIPVYPDADNSDLLVVTARARLGTAQSSAPG